MIGCDLVARPRLGGLFQRYDRDALGMVFTPAEQGAAATSPYADWLAVAFAAKEAVGKALGTGLASIDWRDVEALPGRDDAIAVTLRGRAAARSKELELGEWACRWTREGDDHLFVVAIAEKPEERDSAHSHQ